MFIRAIAFMLVLTGPAAAAEEYACLIEPKPGAEAGRRGAGRRDLGRRRARRPGEERPGGAVGLRSGRSERSDRPGAGEERYGAAIGTGPAGFPEAQAGP